MNIKDALAREHSKHNTTAIVNYIGNDAAHFAELVNVFKTGDYRLIQRAAWPLSYVVEHNPNLVLPHLAKLLDLMNEPLHIAFKRNMFRLLRTMKEIPEEHHGFIADQSMKAIGNMHDPAAVRAMAIHVMGKLVAIYPELSSELKLMLEPLTDHELPSIRSSARKVLKQVR